MSGSGISVRLEQAGPIPLDVAFECEGGELLVIVGPSGSGKTTVLRSIAGLHSPAAGRVVCRDRTWFDSAASVDLRVQQRHAGMVFQHYALFPHLTAAQNIMLAVRARSGGDRRARAAGLMGMVNMTGLENRYPHQLSGGQQQRVALARALAREPDVLLLDEPFSAVDQQTRRKLMRELARLHQQIRMPVILVTHDLDEARMLGDQISVIHHGCTLQTGDPPSLMRRPDSAQIARLLGLDNVFSGNVLKHDDERTWIRWFDYELECAAQPGFAPGTAIDWVIPAENLILHRRDRPSRGERENPVPGMIEDFLTLGEFSSVTIRVNGNGQQLFLSIPTHVARRNGLAAGSPITVSLLAEAIHLMAKERDSGLDARGSGLGTRGSQDSDPR